MNKRLTEIAIREADIDFDPLSSMWIQIDRIAKRSGWSLGFTVSNLARHALGMYPIDGIDRQYMERAIAETAIDDPKPNT